MSEETPQAWQADISADEVLGAPATVQDEGVAGAWLLGLFGALVLGILGAALGGAIWFGSVVLTEKMYAALALLVGMLAGGGVYLGSGRRRSILLGLLAAVLTLIALALSEYFIVRHFTIQQLAAEGGKGSHLPLLMPLQDMLDIVVESVKSDPMNLLFWLGGCVVAFFVPIRKR